MKTRLALAAVSLFCMLELLSAREPDCCARCGCKCPVKKVCRLVCEEKEIKEVKWTCECEDFCVPGRSELCGERCECDPSKPHGQDCDKVWKPTTCAEVRTRNILIKKEVSKKVPSFKWVVEYCCDDCHAAAEAETAKMLAEGAVPDRPAPVDVETTPAKPADEVATQPFWMRWLR